VLVWTGLGTGCDVVIGSKDTGFGTCSLTGQFVGDHVAITSASLLYNSAGYTWYFNQVSNAPAGPFVPSVPSLRPAGFAAVGLMLAAAGILALRRRER
jgi:hypothetical protein